MPYMSFPHNDQNTPDRNPCPFPQETNLNPNVDDSGAFLGQELVRLNDLSILGQWREVDRVDEAGCSRGRLPESCAAAPEAKKHDHNAKERARRLKLSSSYLNLGALLPDFQTSKKRWSAPVIVDRVVKYIPELQNEIQNLTIKKQNMLAETGDYYNQRSQAPTVTVHEIRNGEMVLYICSRRNIIRDDTHLASLVPNIEAEGLCVLNVSTVSAPDDRLFSYQIHVQVGESSVRARYYNAEALRDKVISWLGS